MRVHADPDKSACVHTFDAAHLWSVTHRAKVPSATTSVWGAGVSPECSISSAALSIVFLCGSGSGSSSRIGISHKAQRRATVTLSDLCGVGAFRPWASWQRISARSFLQNRRLSSFFLPKYSRLLKTVLNRRSTKTLQYKYSYTVYCTRHIQLRAARQCTSTQHITYSECCKQAWNMNPHLTWPYFVTSPARLNRSWSI